jgi:thioredoxin reductase (NADPH)
MGGMLQIENLGLSMSARSPALPWIQRSGPAIEPNAYPGLSSASSQEPGCLSGAPEPLWPTDRSVGVIHVYGTNWCGDCKRAKKFFGEHRIPYEWTDIDNDEHGQLVVIEANDGKRVIPTIFFDDGTVLSEPSNADLARQLGIKATPNSSFYDLVVVGGGPTGLTAALYAARDGYDVLVVDRAGFGGQAGITEKLDNYPGFPEGIGGGEFADRLAAQCARFGVEMWPAAEVVELAQDGRHHLVVLSDGQQIASATVLLALGSTYRRLGVMGEEDFIGAGVHFCATCDGAFYRDREVAVIGGGNSAAEEAVFLTRYASMVTILVREDKLSASAVAIEKAMRNPKIKIRYGVKVDAFAGTSTLSAVRIHSGEGEEDVEVAAAFVFIGLKPNTEMLPLDIALTKDGFVSTSDTLETSVAGVFSAGDVRAGSTKQLVSAAGEGATAALMIRAHIERSK